MRTLYLLVLILLEQNFDSLFISGCKKNMVRGGEGALVFFIFKKISRFAITVHPVHFGVGKGPMFLPLTSSPLELDPYLVGGDSLYRGLPSGEGRGGW